MRVLCFEINRSDCLNMCLRACGIARLSCLFRAHGVAWFALLRRCPGVQPSSPKDQTMCSSCLRVPSNRNMQDSPSVVQHIFFAISVVALRAVRQRLHLARAAIRALFGLSGQTFEAMTVTCKHRQYCLCFGCVWNPPRFLSYDQSNVFAFGFISRVSSALLWFIQVSY